MANKNPFYTKELQNKALEMYRANFPYAEICKQLNVTSNNIDYICRKNNEPRRQPKAKKQQSNGGKVCPKCRKKIMVGGARFCCFCGSDIRTENEILAERLDKIVDLFPFIPDTARDEFVSAINQAINTLKLQR